MAPGGTRAIKTPVWEEKSLAVIKAAVSEPIFSGFFKASMFSKGIIPFRRKMYQGISNVNQIANILFEFVVGDEFFFE